MVRMATILLAEDDAALGQQVVDHLRQVELDVVWWRKGRIIDPADLEEVALVILDLMLPGVPGLDMLRALRQVSDVPVLVLSARQDSQDKVQALRLGADDYVTKPFWPQELVERIHARLRRPMMQRERQLRVGGLVLDTERREASLHERRLELTRVELDLLFALSRRAGKPVSRQWLLTHVLDPDREATERTLDVHISRLRKKLGDPALIETVWGIGYRLREVPG